MTQLCSVAEKIQAQSEIYDFKLYHYQKRILHLRHTGVTLGANKEFLRASNSKRLNGQPCSTGGRFVRRPDQRRANDKKRSVGADGKNRNGRK
jgi:DNA-binding transcriptional MerR regulator